MEWDTYQFQRLGFAGSTPAGGTNLKFIVMDILFLGIAIGVIAGFLIGWFLGIRMAKKNLV